MISPCIFLLQVAQKVPNLQRHAKTVLESVGKLQEDIKLLRRYASKMNNASEAYRRMGHSLPSGRALHLRLLAQQTAHKRNT